MWLQKYWEEKWQKLWEKHKKKPRFDLQTKDSNINKSLFRQENIKCKATKILPQINPTLTPNTYIRIISYWRYSTKKNRKKKNERKITFIELRICNFLIIFLFISHGRTWTMRFHFNFLNFAIFALITYLFMDSTLCIQNEDVLLYINFYVYNDSCYII